MKRFPAGLTSPALLVFFIPLAACLPNPDVSGLPPFDASADDTGVITLADAAGQDSTLPPVDGGSQDAAADSDAADSAVPMGTVNGVVVDYTEANGKGVLPGATVSISLPAGSTATVPALVTTDANGLFSIPNVPAGLQVEISVTKPSDKVHGIAYSTALVVGTVVAGQTLSVFPVVHEGCFQTFVLNPGTTDAGNQPVTLQNAQCLGGPGSTTRTGAYAALLFETTSFADQSTGSLYAGSIRVEMIPLAYPSNSGTPDLSWALGLPGSTTPPALLGAAEYRVVKSDPDPTVDGQILTLSASAMNGSAPVSLVVPTYTTPGASPSAYSFDPVAQAWTPETAAVPQAGSINPSGDGGTGPTIQYETFIVSHIAPATWWAVSNGSASTTCVTGTITGATGTNVFVRAAGSSYLGDSTATTSAGSFCLGVTPNSTIELFAGAMLGAVPAGIVQTGISVAPGTGTCGPTPTGCVSLGNITLNDSLSCVAGDVAAEDGGAVPSALNVVESFSVTTADLAAGIQPTAYVGQALIGSGGAFCALGAPNGSVYLSDPNSCNVTPSVSVPIGSNAPSCAAGGCADAGPLLLDCP